MSLPKVTKELQQRVFELTLALYRVTDFFPQGEALRKHLREKANEIFGAISEFNFYPESDRNATFLAAKIEAMKGYLALARSMRFVKPINLSILEREYAFLLQVFMPLYTENLDSGVQDEKNHSSKEFVKETEKVEAAVVEDEPHDLPKWNDFTAKDTLEIKEEYAPPQTDEDKEPEAIEYTPHKNGLSSISHDINERQKKILEHMRDAAGVKISDFYSVFSGISSKTIQRDLQDLVVKNVLKKEGDKRWTIYSLNMSDSI